MKQKEKFIKIFCKKNVWKKFITKKKFIAKVIPLNKNLNKVKNNTKKQKFSYPNKRTDNGLAPSRGFLASLFSFLFIFSRKQQKKKKYWLKIIL